MSDAFKVDKFHLTLEDASDGEGFILVVKTDPPLPDNLDNIVMSPAAEAFSSIISFLKGTFSTEVAAGSNNLVH
jgi:hypothetical protein